MGSAPLISPAPPASTRSTIRVILAGTPAERASLRAKVAARPEAIMIAAEVATLAAANASAIDADAILMQPQRSGPERDSIDEPLTAREIQVLELLAEGLANKAIASRLRISDQTVKFHVAAICGKLGAKNRTDVVRRAIRRGVVAI